MRVWDAQSGKELRKYGGHNVARDTNYKDVVFFPDGKRIACTSCDGTTRIWRAPR